MLHRPNRSLTCTRSTAAECRAVRAPAAPRRYLTLPSITYSNHKGDINLLQLQQLYDKVSKHTGLSSAGSGTQRSFFRHWEELSDEEAQEKLQLLLQKSVAVSAAFVREQNLYTIDEDSDDKDSETASTSSSSSSRSGGSTRTSSSSSSSSLGTWGPFAWRQRLPRRLVGFVRASGDHALVATVHDLLIHPDLQGFGLGSMLLKRLVAQISDEGVYDVGTVTPSHLQPFFHTCSFELDRENSIPMALGNGWSADVEQINSKLLANGKLEVMLQSVKM